MSWYRQHNNTHPVTNEPLTPADLIPLHYARKASGEYHDPISFKPFNEHSHIVAIATTGNIFLADSIKGGVDLVDDVRFKKYVLHVTQGDTLLLTWSQRGCDHTPESPRNSVCFRFYCKAFSNPKRKGRCSCKTSSHGTRIRYSERSCALSVSSLPPLLSANPPGLGNISPYSSGAPGASLTSTSVDPQTATSRLIWDEVRLPDTVVITCLIISLGGNNVRKHSESCEREG
jgi:peptidyl-prolyl cis-trans isomerase-like protein 2